MGFGEERETADAAGMIELMPRDLTEYVEIEIANDAIEKGSQAIEICKRRRVAPACVDEPFGSEGHVIHRLRRLYRIIRVICGWFLLARQRSVRQDRRRDRFEKARQR